MLLHSEFSEVITSSAPVGYLLVTSNSPLTANLIMFN